MSQQFTVKIPFYFWKLFYYISFFFACAFIFSCFQFESSQIYVTLTLDMKYIHKSLAEKCKIAGTVRIYSIKLNLIAWREEKIILLLLLYVGYIWTTTIHMHTMRNFLLSQKFKFDDTTFPIRCGWTHLVHTHIHALEAESVFGWKKK